VPGHLGTVGNGMADRLARQGSSYPLTEPQPALGVSVKVVRGVISAWTNMKHNKYWQSMRGQNQPKGFLKRLSAKKS
jgi:hypothetical protein